MRPIFFLGLALILRFGEKNLIIDSSVKDYFISILNNFKSWFYILNFYSQSSLFY